MFRHSPIYLTGLPRSGTTWVAAILGAASGIKYIHEPFNSDIHPELAPYRNQFLQAGDLAPEFAPYCRAAFSGLPKTPLAPERMSRIYRQFPWWPGRLLIKDVHTFLALDWISQRFTPKIVITIRHPCAIAESWARLGWQTQKAFSRLLDQPELTRTYLAPFEPVLETAETFWQTMGALWGATYFVISQQLNHHPEWILVQHEAFCRDSISSYQQLFEQLNLNWSPPVEKLLMASTQSQSHHPYSTQRIAAQEAKKWQERLTLEQIQQVWEFAEPFGLNQYGEF
ncbi:MAG: sulfotransferase [Oscillatoriales cyanobacterium RM2_1_1]|nr:sulfotransferase [Oscillatoriales cyanobacterium SM2_3_0]NJO44427.1 sulfotransferase [Oscillatoriales cyanobacterium RM2_1_1]